MKVLIAYDDSECAESALKDLVHAGLPRRGRALVLTIAEKWFPPPPPSVLGIMEQAATAKSALALERSYMSSTPPAREAERIAQRAALKFQTTFPGWKVSAEGVWGSPTRELFSQAEAWKADLIVVGSHGRTALGRLLLGSVSQWLLSEAPCSVRVARAHEDEPDFPVRLLVAVDGSRNANAAVEQVASRHWAAKSEVRVVLVDQPLEATYLGDMISPLRRSVEEFNRKEREKLHRLVRAAAKKLEAKGLRATAELKEGDPKAELVRMAEEWRADCIFLGATGLSNRFERFLLGSVSGAVAARAHCSVEIVRIRKRTPKTNGNGN